MNEHDKYLGCTIVCLRQFVIENIDPYSQAVLLASNNINKAYKRIFNNGQRMFITIGTLKEELLKMVDELYEDLAKERINELALQHFENRKKAYE